MDRRSFVFCCLASSLLTNSACSQESEIFPPVPSWRPSVIPNLDQVADRFRYYTNGERDFVIFRNSTCCIVPLGLSEMDASTAAIEILSKIINFHPDMNPRRMDDGNVLVSYNHPAFNVVLEDFARTNWDEIETRHQDGLTPDEVLLTPLGQNVFDEVGKMALLGRSYMFLDALESIVSGIERSDN